MEKEILTRKQAICLLAMFLFGSTAILGLSNQVEQDSWITLIIAAFMSVPFLLIYARMSVLFPDKNFFEIIEIQFGSIIGKIVIALMSWYCLHLGALVLRDFSEFVEICVMPETPQLPIMLLMIIIVIYLLKSGMEVTGKWAVIMIPVVFGVIIFTVVFSVNKWDYLRLMPVLGHSAMEMLQSSYSFLTFPYLESVAFLCAIKGISRPGKPYGTYLYAALFGTLALLGVILRNTLLLGVPVASAEYFPSYIAVKVIEIGDVFSRIEGSIAMNFVIGGVAKISVCILAASRGISRLFGLRDYKRIIFPVGMLSVALSLALYTSSVEMYEFLKVYQIYAIPFQIIIPVVVWGFAEIRRIAGRGKAKKSIKPAA